MQQQEGEILSYSGWLRGGELWEPLEDKGFK